MRDRMERLVVLPFSVGCISESSVAVAVQRPRRSKTDTTTSAIRSKVEDDLESLSGESMRSSFRLLGSPKPQTTTGIHRLFKGFKNFSQLFVYKEDLEELDMEIGGPTDVKHVTHIGWDASATPNPIMGWDNLISPELLSLPSVSLEQFELSRDRQVDAPLVNGST
ncbi:CRIB domain-containing protein RIC4-like [Fagus crenata]